MGVHTVVDVDAILDQAGVKNPHVREYVRHWSALTGTERVEVISTSDDTRLIEESLDAGEIAPAGEGGTTRAATSKTPPAQRNAPSSPPITPPTKASTTLASRRGNEAAT
jgi:hypothetical protein